MFKTEFPIEEPCVLYNMQLDKKVQIASYNYCESSDIMSFLVHKKGGKHILKLDIAK